MMLSFFLNVGHFPFFEGQFVAEQIEGK